MDKIIKELTAIIAQNTSTKTFGDAEKMLAKLKTLVLVKIGAGTALGGTATGIIVGFWDTIMAFLG